MKKGFTNKSSSRKVSVWDISCCAIPRTKTLRGDGGVQAFTLIELLVVVLIIGILAAIALPQYQVAVDKTKVMGAYQLARSVKMAEEEYYLANSTYTTNQEDLALSFAQNTGNTFIANGFEFRLKEQTTGVPWSVYASELNKIGVLLIVGYDQGSYKGVSRCYALPTSTRGKKACSGFTGKEPYDESDDYWRYKIEF